MSTFVNPVTAAVVFRGGELWRLGSDLMLLDCLGRVTVVDFSSSGDENVVSGIGCGGDVCVYCKSEQV